MQQTAVQALQRYWEEKFDGSQLPSRADIVPEKIGHLLQFAFIAEQITPSIAKFRVAGNMFHDLMGMDVRGMPLSAMFTPPSRAKLADAITRSRGLPAHVHMSLGAETGIGRPAITGILAFSPLRPQRDGLGSLLGILATDGKIGRAPRRFNIVSARLLRICLHSSSANLGPGLKEEQEPFRSGRAPKLKLVTENGERV